MTLSVWQKHRLMVSKTKWSITAWLLHTDKQAHAKTHARTRKHKHPRTQARILYTHCTHSDREGGTVWKYTESAVLMSWAVVIKQDNISHRAFEENGCRDMKEISLRDLRNTFKVLSKYFTRVSKFSSVDDCHCNIEICMSCTSHYSCE